MDILIDLESSHDERIVLFLLEVLIDDQQPTEVRIYALKRVRNGDLAPGIRVRVAEVITHLLADGSPAELRLRAALALGGFTDVSAVLGVLDVLGTTALDRAAPLELRYAAFTSLERAGPTPQSVSLLRKLVDDDALGRTARSALLAWHISEEEQD